MKTLFLFLFLALALFLPVQAQNRHMIAGTVMDETGEPLIGVNIIDEGKKLEGTITDLDGRFRLDGVPQNTTIVFSYIGYKNKKYKVTSSKERLQIVLDPDVSSLDEVVVVGQAEQRKVSVTGAITSVKPDILSTPTSSITNMLGGNVPGIIAVTRSGEPGDDFSEFWIRGISTFGANSSALVLVDGVEGNLNDLDPSDIESFSVLKDA